MARSRPRPTPGIYRSIPRFNSQMSSILMVLISSENRSARPAGHSDFVVRRNQWEPDYAVQFDGRYHSTPTQIARDEQMNRLRGLAGFPIPAHQQQLPLADFWVHIAGGLVDRRLRTPTGLRRTAGVRGHSSDEPFDPLLFMSVDPEDERFPYTAPIRGNRSVLNESRAVLVVRPSRAGDVRSIA